MSEISINDINQWDIWLTEFPLEEDNSQSISRPVIVLSVKPMWIMSVKVTKHNPRENDPYDIEIKKWKESGLNYPSTARVAKSNKLHISNFKKYLGQLHSDDRINVINAFIDFTQHAMVQEEKGTAKVVNE